MNLFTVLAAGTVAASVISPLPDPAQTYILTDTAVKPEMTFEALAQSVIIPDVLGATDSANLLATASAVPSKTAYTIAVLGDSMVDTLGVGIPHLYSKLKSAYPKQTFTLLNYGVGASNIEYGIKRLREDYEYLGIHIPSLLSQLPDIVIIESFAYNPLALDRDMRTDHWAALGTLTGIISRELPNTRIMIAATIAPNDTVFGDGVPGTDYSPEEKQKRVKIIKEYLENAAAFARAAGLPLADAYHRSLDSKGNGKLAYINAGDHIHYSESGKALLADTIVSTINEYNLLR
ncbi:hypothetical protein A2Z33_00525 [Candidatus Gottesmanbacteria bacterium RBG_16_52_11]|uniref:SGNH hydrolase-type esterase domain-containing protein n=1 Tax=Candidatus Gottesmanbacteria bacterium RBG_16_52_11 TaxID=1798374 RepID=A0A1F5YNH4_9BACT|nr:MAG: hypothetical protein A2Z33_00525 [Candidatus Gottesmanbacteria bacterium RBG_16_52_11]